MDYFGLAAKIIPLVYTGVQVIQASSSLTGVEKSAVVLQTVANQLPPDIAQHPETTARIQGYINMAVAMFNMFHPMFKKNAAPAAPVPIASVPAQ